MVPRIRLVVCCCALALIASEVAPAAAQGYQGYPYSIMTPEPGTAGHHRATAVAPARPPRASLLGREKFVAKLHRSPKVFVSARILWLGLADTVAANAGHSARGRRYRRGPGVAERAEPDAFARPKAHPQLAARSRDLPG